MVSLVLVHIAKKLVGAEGALTVCVRPADLTSAPPLIEPLVAADGHADGAFDSALGGRNDGQARSMGPQTDVRSRLGRYREAVLDDESERRMTN